MSHSPELRESVKAMIEREDVKFINLQFTDVVGIVKNITIPVQQFDEAVEYGVWFDGSSIEGFARIAESDMFLMMDLSTFAVIPWERGPRTTARVICDVYTPWGEPFPGDPRGVLRTVMRQAEEMGFLYNTGPRARVLPVPPQPRTAVWPPTPTTTRATSTFRRTWLTTSGVRWWTRWRPSVFMLKQPITRLPRASTR